MASAEDELLMKRAETEASGASVYADDQRLAKQPSVLQNGTLRDYELEGLNWMVPLSLLHSAPLWRLLT